MEKRWSKAEVAHLKKHARSQSLDELARRLTTDKETVRRKLTELKLAPGADGPADSGDALERFGKAVGLVHDGEWGRAVAVLEELLAGSDSRQLSARVRQYLNVCYQNLEEAAAEGDPYLRAVFEKNRGNLETALALCQKQGNPEEEEHVAYLMASIRALAGQHGEALSYLAIAIRLEPKNRIHAYHDPDFKALRSREEFSRLLSGAPGKGAKGAAGRR